MSLARKAAIAFLSFLLFVSLSGLGFAFTLSRTVLDPEFVVSRMDDLEVVPLVGGILKEQVPQEVTSLVPAELVDEALDDVLTELEPWLREQMAQTVYSGYDYLLGDSRHLVLEIDVGPVKEQVMDEMRRALLASPPAGLEMIPPAQLEQMFDAFYAQIAGEIPSTVTIDEDTLNEMDPQIMTTLATIKHYIGYFRIIYLALIIATGLLIMGIILLNRRVKGATRWIGIPCLISGIATYVATFAIKHFAGGAISSANPPPELQSWLTHLLDDAMVPLGIYGIVLMAVGVALLIVSVAYKRGRYEQYEY
ncbi:MAG: hypothetical protein JW790_03600 [Dehalococcoidales bacterium]|nr:hypothetical protein [Dehalococcoidales bacterium]